jgi:hypothetical protein
MRNEAKTLSERARALPLEDRIALVEDVLDSLDHADRDIDQLWVREQPTVWPPTGAVSSAPKT